jgi:hypothetical protein
MANTDRRFDERHNGTGLVIHLDGYEAEVLDVSIGGLKFAPPEGYVYQPQNKLAFELSSTRWPEMRKGHGTAVVRAATPKWVAIQFLRPTYDLMKCVSRHVGTLLWGDKPYGY